MKFKHSNGADGKFFTNAASLKKTLDQIPKDAFPLNMKIHFNNKEIDILVDTSSYRYTALQNVGTLYLYFASEEFINIPVGAYCIYKNITYYLMDPDDFKKKSSRNFEYTLVMYDIGAILGKYKCRDIVSKRLKFDYTAKPHEHLQLIVDNLNMRDSGWKVGECIEAEDGV